jgi:hypothetical protein
MAATDSGCSDQAGRAAAIEASVQCPQNVVKGSDQSVADIDAALKIDVSSMSGLEKAAGLQAIGVEAVATGMDNEAPDAEVGTMTCL